MRPVGICALGPLAIGGCRVCFPGPGGGAIYAGQEGTEVLLSTIHAAVTGFR